MNDDTTSALRAVAHPVRLQILSLLTGTELSAAEVARELGISHANASYHLRTLLEAGAVVISSEEKIRGGVAKRYRHPWEMDAAATEPGARREPGRRTSVEDRALYVRAMAEEMVRRAHLSQTGTRSHFTDAELWVSPEDYAQVEAAITQASVALHAAARPPRTDGTVRVSLTAAMFRMEAGR
jgi:DNA-binding transcriptional ArsR family regulator